MGITTIVQKTTVDDVGEVTISEIVQDTENNVWVREIKVFGPADDQGTKPLVFTLRVEGDTSASVQLNAPAQTF